MLSIFSSVVAEIAIVLGVAVILSKTVPRMPNKVCRFVLLFVLWVPVTSVVNYVNIRTLGYHKMGWTAASIIAVLLATCGTFWPPQPHNSNTP
jgi:hypothetical protein